MGEKIKIAINAGVGFGAKLTAKQLITIATYIEEDNPLEMTTFQQLYIDIDESKQEEITEELKSVGLSVYPVGSYVKSLRTCNFCKGAEEEGMPVAIELNNRMAGKPVPFTMKVAYTGCANGCGEPLVNDIGIIKMKDTYDLYIGGKAKGIDAQVGTLFKSNLTPEQLYEAVENLIKIYNKNGRRREGFSSFINRMNLEEKKGANE